MNKCTLYVPSAAIIKPLENFSLTQKPTAVSQWEHYPLKFNATANINYKIIVSSGMKLGLENQSSLISF